MRARMTQGPVLWGAALLLISHLKAPQKKQKFEVDRAHLWQFRHRSFPQLGTAWHSLAQLPRLRFVAGRRGCGGCGCGGPGPTGQGRRHRRGGGLVCPCGIRGIRGILQDQRVRTVK